MAGDTPEQDEGSVGDGRYRLLRMLDAGGLGRVWLAYDEELACEVAVKEMSLPDASGDGGERAQRVARARGEVRHAAGLRRHPHVAIVHDVVIHEGLPWVVMEYVPDGVDLRAVLGRSGPLPPARVARIGLAVLDALTAGHRMGILHRDVKPANILLAPDASGDPYARVLLTGYGIALHPETHEPRLTTTGYLAPERARGEPPTPAADLFSLGATLYAAVEGHGPFDRHDDFATLTALLGEEPTPAVRAGELAPVLQGLLVKDPASRSTPEAAARGLERVGRRVGAAPGGLSVPDGVGRGRGDLGRMPDGFGPVAEGFGSAPDGFGPVAEGFGSAPDGFGPVAEGFGSPPDGFGPPPEGFGSAPDGFGSAPVGFGPAPAGFGSAPDGFGPAPGGRPTADQPPGAVADGAHGSVGSGPPGYGGSGRPGHPEGDPPGHVASRPRGQVPGGQPGYAVGGPYVGGPYAPQTPGGPRAAHQDPASYSDRAAAALGGSTPGSRPAPGTPGTPEVFGTPEAPGALNTPDTPPIPSTPNTPAGSESPYSPQGLAGAPGGGSYGRGNPYANSPTASYRGGAPTRPYAGGQGPTYPGGPGSVGGGGRRRPVGAVLALVVAVVLVVAGGVWAVTSSGGGGKDTAATKKAPPSASSSTGSAYPYGEDVGLKKALRTGDCVHAVWTGAAFAARPGLRVVSCARGVPDGQVMAVDAARDFADARDHGGERCAGKVKATAESLADAGVYALTPTEAGFKAAGGGTACLVLGRQVPIGGAIGRFRSIGSNVWTTEMSVGDCWSYVDHKTYFTANLTDCADPHTDQVIGFVTAPGTMAFEEALKQGNKLCGDRFASTWASGADRSVFGYLSDESNWKAGFDSVVCTVGRADRSRTSGAISSSGTTASALSAASSPGVGLPVASGCQPPGPGHPAGRGHTWRAGLRSSRGWCSPCSEARCCCGPRSGSGTANPSPRV
ncbi:serine/threonine-protein kinase [Streptomyces sp. N50]|uniref:serine/threonine-protein kinase n=1 Tax=Streptomyces sp. N50 TaxID=3081765 RepID=UPI00296227A6|nr:protein kinase [Streptomyces sp. N50]WOX11397.1 protein kinase [Streptomyces sp. N50]